MKIGGILKNSFIDFPSQISCVLFTAGCNFKCPYCHNPELVSPPFSTLSIEEILAFLDKRKSLLDGVVITGGEPTLQPDLSEFCEKIKSMDLLIKIDTNGSRPPAIHSLIKSSLVDYIAMDVKTLPGNYSPLISSKINPESIANSIDSIKKSGLPHEFRTTCVKPLVNSDIIEQIARIIEGADLFVLQKGKIKNSVLRPEFFQDQDWSIETPELNAFQKIASPFVKKTIIR